MSFLSIFQTNYLPFLAKSQVFLSVSSIRTLLIFKNFYILKNNSLMENTAKDTKLCLSCLNIRFHKWESSELFNGSQQISILFAQQTVRTITLSVIISLDSEYINTILFCNIIFTAISFFLVNGSAAGPGIERRLEPSQAYIMRQWCCYMTMDSETTALQNVYCTD